MSAKASRPPIFSSGRKIAKNNSVRCSLWGSSSDGAPGPRRCVMTVHSSRLNVSPRVSQNIVTAVPAKRTTRPIHHSRPFAGSVRRAFAGATSDAGCVVALTLGGDRSAG